jgi:hypothetical protein
MRIESLHRAGILAVLSNNEDGSHPKRVADLLSWNWQPVNPIRAAS